VKPPRIFLLSPATCSGRRAQVLRSPAAQFDLAVQVRSPEGAPLGEVFTFLSGLYFRGKLAYAQTFARPPRRLHAEKGEKRTGYISEDREKRTGYIFSGVFVITPSRGLRAPGYPVTARVLEEFAQVQIEVANPAYRRPLEASARLVAELAGRRAEVVLLGSIATGKYVDVLLDVFGDRVLFPAEFVGRGDMSRGGLLLRHAASGEELDYSSLRPDTPRRGARPPRLEPHMKTRAKPGIAAHPHKGRSSPR